MSIIQRFLSFKSSTLLHTRANWTSSDINTTEDDDKGTSLSLNGKLTVDNKNSFLLS